MSKKMIAAHRGASAYVHENTLEAFRLAVEMGADMIELDVRQTADMQVVVFHDASIDNISIDSLTYDKMQSIAQRFGFSVPTLEETIKRFAQDISFDIELKDRSCAQKVLDMMSNYKALFHKTYYIVTSFDRDLIRSIHRKDSGVLTGMLFSEHESDELHSLMNESEQMCVHTDYLCLHRNLVSEEVLRKSHLPIIIWTVDNKDEIKRLLLQENIFGVITNTPDVGVKVRNEIDAESA